MDQVDSVSLGYTTLSALNLDGAAIESNVVYKQPDSHSSHLRQDMRFQVNENVSAVSGLSELNHSLRSAKSSFTSGSCGSQDQARLVATTENILPTLGSKGVVVSRDLPAEGSRISKIGKLLNDSPISVLNTEKGQDTGSAALNVKFEEMSQALATKFHNGSNDQSLEEIKSLIKNEFWDLLKNCGTRKRSFADDSLMEPLGSKRRLVACDRCPKKLLRECDLKYKGMS
jgi:hypothetical protein